MALDTLLIVAALILMILAAIGFSVRRVNLMAASLSFYLLAVLLAEGMLS